MTSKISDSMVNIYVGRLLNKNQLQIVEENHGKQEVINIPVLSLFNKKDDIVYITNKNGEKIIEYNLKELFPVFFEGEFTYLFVANKFIDSYKRTTNSYQVNLHIDGESKIISLDKYYPAYYQCFKIIRTNNNILYGQQIA